MFQIKLSSEAVGEVGQRFWKLEIAYSHSHISHIFGFQFRIQACTRNNVHDLGIKG